MARAQTTYFQAHFFEFLRQLALHNDRAWFAENKSRFEADVQAPALRFIAEAGPRLRSLFPHLIVDPRPFGGSLARIYRDTRFSRDKRPYYTHVGIHFWHGAAGKAKFHLPGFFLHIDPNETVVYSGVWRPEAATLKAIRDRVADRPAEWKKVTRSPIELYGESLKRPPSGYDAAHPRIEDLKRKDFVGRVAFARGQVGGPEFLPAFLKACRTMDPLNRFLADALQVGW